MTRSKVLRTTPLVLAAALLAAGVAPPRPAAAQPPAAAGPPALAAIDRSIRKEPAYRSGAPRYCLLVLGAEAKTRVWLVLDGDALYVDRNGNGDLTEAGERVTGKDPEKVADSPYAEGREFPAGDLSEGPAGPVHTELTVARLVPNPKFVPTEKTDPVDRQVKALLDKHPGVTVAVVGAKVGGRRLQAAAPAFAARPADAPVVHLNGPLSLGLESKWCYGWPVLGRGEPGTKLTVAVGTPGLGEGSFAALDYDDVPRDAHPVAAFRFPHRDPGRPPVVVEVPLKHRC